jgi:phosphatidylinositol glycan class M
MEIDKVLKYIDKNRFLSFALIGRFILVYIASIIDEKTPNMKYTDTDYDVFSDAATHIYNNRSPYERHTFRYTPLAAYICLLNNIVHPLAGKIVFCILDVLMGIFMWSLIESQNKNNKYTMLYVAFWIYNPVTVGMSTRGSNDNIIALLVFASLYFLLKK